MELFDLLVQWFVKGAYALIRYSLLYAVLWGVLYWRLIRPLNVTRPVKVGLTLFVGSLALPPMLLPITHGLISPEVARPELLWAVGSGMVVMLVALVVLLRDGVRFFLWGVGKLLPFFSTCGCVQGEGKGFTQTASRALLVDRRSALGVGVLGTGLALLGIKEGIKVPDVTRHQVAIPGLPDALVGFTFVQLSDLHASRLLTAPHMEALVEKVNALKPDAVFITGDMADGLMKNRLADTAPLGKLVAPYGVWVCEGNHEHYMDYDAWVERVKALGFTLLRNAHGVIEVKGVPIVVAGVTDPMAKRFDREGPDVEKAFAGAPMGEGIPRVLLAHQPRFTRDYVKRVPFDLQLSGHTHGGQVFGMDQAVKVLNDHFVRGWYQVGATKLYVHSGSGLWNGFPIRLGVPSEIALMTLVAG